MGKINDMKEVMQAMAAWATFKKNHPEFPGFIEAAQKEGVHEGTILSFSMETPEGKKIETNLKVQESDLEFLRIARYLK